jgi:hypothetical protein
MSPFPDSDDLAANIAVFVGFVKSFRVALFGYFRELSSR